MFSSVQSLSCVRLFATPWIAARQASCPSPSPGVHSNSRPSSWWCLPAISSSVVSSSCPQSLPASESFPMSQLFSWGGQSTGVSALASFLPKKSQGWSASVRSIPFLSFIVPIFAWNIPLVSLIFLKRSLVFPVLLISSISFHWSLRKAFLYLLALLWNSAFRCVYLSFSPLLLAFLFSASCKASSDNHFAFVCFFSLGMVLITAFCTVSWTSFHSFSGTPSIRSNPLNLFVTYVNGLVVFPTFFNLSLNVVIRSSRSEPQSAPGVVFSDCIKLLHLRLQRI